MPADSREALRVLRNEAGNPNVTREHKELLTCQTVALDPRPYIRISLGLKLDPSMETEVFSVFSDLP